MFSEVHFMYYVALDLLVYCYVVLPSYLFFRGVVFPCSVRGGCLIMYLNADGSGNYSACFNFRMCCVIFHQDLMYFRLPLKYM
jgi:hypothetical protein